mmetsp:Transcript_35591/g.54411  ORF Transcript_35591/g.54411 Transcript_35591/m.54411 type:complete len:111 (+) Transcript_35591:759-1091(+)|eukprot:CAMPEP_0170498820 /NCGR_PEP_ID=MMETSP0208-20121228/29103_1 /TAXON_ID=197538 /ORGANISM="Strombidium inclinatum, Strain S3" /LENGTH=110 /DNA_ID=CAMNT_0010776115 /DNA_START=707 /DNA_END=1039 /DNA_ORIENTATION=-
MLLLLELHKQTILFTWDRIINQISNNVTKSTFSNFPMFQRYADDIISRIEADIFKSLMLDREVEVRPGFTSGFDKFNQHQLKDMMARIDWLDESQKFTPEQISKLKQVLK